MAWCHHLVFLPCDAGNLRYGAHSDLSVGGAEPRIYPLAGMTYVMRARGRGRQTWRTFRSNRCREPECQLTPKRTYGAECLPLALQPAPHRSGYRSCAVGCGCTFLLHTSREVNEARRPHTCSRPCAFEEINEKKKSTKSRAIVQ